MRCIFDMVINTPIPWKIFSRVKFSHEQFEKLIRIHYLNISVYYFSYLSSLVFFYICHILHIHSFIHSFIHLFIHSSIHSFIQPFIYSFIQSFVHSIFAIFNENHFKSNSCFYYKAAICIEKASEYSKICQYIFSVKVGIKTLTKVGMQVQFYSGKNFLGIIPT